MFLYFRYSRGGRHQTSFYYLLHTTMKTTTHKNSSGKWIYKIWTSLMKDSYWDTHIWVVIQDLKSWETKEKVWRLVLENEIAYEVSNEKIVSNMHTFNDDYLWVVEELSHSETFWITTCRALRNHM